MESNTLFGNLPTNWKLEPLYKLTRSIKRGHQPKYSDRSDSIPVINQKMIRNRSIDYQYVKYHDINKSISEEAFVCKNDILINSTGVGTVGRSVFISDEIKPAIFADSHVTIVRPDIDLVNPRYLSIVLSSAPYTRFLEETLAQGSTGQVELSRKKLQELEVPIPSENTQQIIANTFEGIDEKITLNQQINNNLLQMMDLIWRHARKDRLTKLGDISNIRAGKRPIDRYEAFQEGLVPLVGGSGMMGWTSQSLVKTPIITTGRVGANIGTNGVTHMFDYPVWVSDNSLIITSNYLPVVFEMLRCDVDFSSLIHGTSQPLITQSDLKQYKVLLPNERRLNRINSYFLAITNLIEGNKAENRILSTVRDLMLPKLLAGDIDLSNIEAVMNNA
jgi:type I restriction enzyme S subunit